MLKKLWTRTIEVGTIDKNSQFDGLLHGSRCSLDQDTRTLLRAQNFSRYPYHKTIEAVCVLLTKEYHHDGIIYEAYDVLSLVPGETELAPQLGIQYKDQPNGEEVHVITQPIRKDFLCVPTDPRPKKFCLRTLSHKRDLRILTTNWDTIFRPGTKFVFTQAG